VIAPDEMLWAFSQCCVTVEQGRDGLPRAP
jgi:hypothetical protein